VIGPPVAIAVGFALDRIVGEPPVSIHPLAGFGSLMKRVEAAIYRNDRAAGVAMCGTGVAIGIGTGLLGTRLFGRHVAVALSVFVAVAGKMLADEALAVGSALESGQLNEARVRLVSLVGRDTAELGESDISRAVVESLAENTVDAVIASVWWAAVGGAPAVLAHRAVNTLDAMVGYRSDRYEHFGWASAKLDDLVNWVRARIAAIATAIVRPLSAAKVWRAVRRDARQHPSPNGGVIEAAFAAALQIQLGGTNQYGDHTEERGLLGDGRPAQLGDVGRAVTLARDISTLSALMIPAFVSFGRWLIMRPSRL
jgi:adenosylcobinamide-phosphate synthase